MLLFSQFEFTKEVFIFLLSAIAFSLSITPIIVKIINENLLGKFISRLIHHK
jgi:hypothetical protein